MDYKNFREIFFRITPLVYNPSHRRPVIFVQPYWVIHQGLQQYSGGEGILLVAREKLFFVLGRRMFFFLIVSVPVWASVEDAVRPPFSG